MHFRGLPLLLLTTIGAKSGERRQTLVAWFADEAQPQAWLVVASDAGADKHPAWFRNLMAHPEAAMVQILNRTTKVHPEVLTAAERATVWPRITTEGPEFVAFQARTKRILPVVRLLADGR